MRECKNYRWIWGAAGLGLAGCAFSVAPTATEDKEISLELAIFPARLSVEDTLATAEVWATVRQGDKPIKDSTAVAFATTVGTITATSLTHDGLAVALLTGPGDSRPRTGEVVAQVLTMRDAIEVDLVFFEQQ